MSRYPSLQIETWRWFGACMDEEKGMGDETTRDCFSAITAA